MNKFFLLLCALMLVVGCGGAPTLDASSEESLKSSMEAMAKNLSEEEKQKFAASVAMHGMGNMFQAAMSGEEGEEKELHAMLKDLHGLTAQQIIAKGQEKADAP